MPFIGHQQKRNLCTTHFTIDAEQDTKPTSNVPLTGMTTLIRAALLERFPEGLPRWTEPFLEGIDQLELSNVEDERKRKAEEIKMFRVIWGRSNSPAELGEWTEEEEMKYEPAEQATLRAKAEENFRAVSRIGGVSLADHNH